MCIICSLSFVLLSCSKDISLNNDSRSQVKESPGELDANMILIKYLDRQNGDSLVLNISQEVAELMGVSAMFYEKAALNVAEGNLFIQNAKKDTNHTITIDDPQSQSSNDIVSKADDWMALPSIIARDNRPEKSLFPKVL